MSERSVNLAGTAAGRSTANRRTRRQLVGFAEAAEHAAVAPRTIRRWVAEGRLTGYRVNARVIRVDMDELDALFVPMTTGGAR